MTRRSTVTKTMRTPDGDSRTPYRSKLEKTTRDRKKGDLRWFMPDREDRATKLPDAHGRVFAQVERLAQKQAARRQMALHLACLYDDVEMGGLGPGSWEPAYFEASHLAFNVVRQMVDTVTAMVCKERPLPMPLTSGGKFEQQRRARELGRWVEGDFEETGVWKTDPSIGRDAALWGTGIAENWRNGDKIMHERCFPWEIIVDPREAMYGKPASLFRRRWIDRLALIERFPKFEEQIEGADNRGAGFDGEIGYDDSSDQVLVVTAWHPPSGPEAKNGRRAICISNATLEFEEWDRNYFPLSVLRMTDPLIGWFSTGLGQLLTGLQYTINDMALKVQELQQLAGTYLLVSHNSDIETEHLDNDPLTIIRHAPGQPPGQMSVQPGDPAQWQFVQQLIPWANAVTGVSQQAAQALKPPGITAARALEHLSDEQSGRFALFSRNFDQYHVDTAWQHIDLAEEIQNDGGKVTTRVAARMPSGKRRLREIDFAKVKIDRDAYVLQVWPTSILPKTPAGRMQIIDDLEAKGFIDKSEARMLLDFPDLDKSGNVSQSSYNAIIDVLDRIQDAKDPRKAYERPDPFMNFDMAIALGLQAYLDAKVEGADPEVLKWLRRWVTDARAMKKKATPPPAPPPVPGPAGPPGMPPGAPMGPPPGPMPGAPMMPPAAA